MANEITINDSGVQNLLNDLSNFQKSEMLLKSVQKGAKYLKEKIQSSLVSKFPKAKTAKGKANRTMYEGIVIKTDKTMNEIIVKSTGNYLNPIFEGGTIERYRKVRYKDKKGRTRISKTQKGGYTGKIKPLNFFADARSKEEENTLNIIENEISKELNKLTK